MMTADAMVYQLNLPKIRTVQHLGMPGAGSSPRCQSLLLLPWLSGAVICPLHADVGLTWACCCQINECRLWAHLNRSCLGVPQRRGPSCMSNYCVVCC